MALKKGTKVRFVVGSLGASERDDLGHVTSDVYGPGEGGTIAFRHPNPNLKGWWYVEVDSKGKPGEKRYVGVTERMVEAVP